MSVKEQLHQLVDQLGDERASQALTYLRQLLHDDEAASTTAAALARRMQPQAANGHAFLAQPARTLSELAVEQGVRPVRNFDDLLGDFWPEDETADQFIAAVRQWRDEGGYA
jgi:hypothetical protein